MIYKVAINRQRDKMRDLGRKLDSVTGNITVIDEQVRQLLATKHRFQVLEEDLKLERALEGRQHAYLQQLVLEVSGPPIPLPSGSATGQPTADHTHRELHVEEYGARCVGLEPAVAAKDRSRSPQSGTGTGNVTMVKCPSGAVTWTATRTDTRPSMGRSLDGQVPVMGRSRDGHGTVTQQRLDIWPTHPYGSCHVCA